jgi:hypothetical protein
MHGAIPPIPSMSSFVSCLIKKGVVLSAHGQIYLYFPIFPLRFFPLFFHVWRAVIAQSVWRWAMGWIIGVLGFDSGQRLGIFLFTTASRMAMGPTQPLIQLVSLAL